MDNKVVHVANGKLQGVEENGCYGDRFLAFRGIPYARPPVGELRFKDPEPVESWTGVRDASKFGDVCAQMDLIERRFVGSDDCLYLNVYTPSIEVSKKRAVMVFIHGGGFVNGSGNDSLYGPDYLIRKDIVLVTINYRVGVLGFLNLEHEVAPGNQGLKDQVMALKWIQKNISHFGGDPDNVTIFGESAGGASVHYLAISPMAQGLFHKAITQSGASVNPWARVPVNPKRSAFQLAAKLGKESDDPRVVVDFLRTIEPEQLILNSNGLLTGEESLRALGTFGPGVDDKSPNPFLLQPPMEAMKVGVRVPFLTGFNANEGSFMAHYQLASTKNLLEKVNENFELVLCHDTVEILKKNGVTPKEMRQMYFGDEPITADNMQKYADVQSDIMFVRGIYDVVKVQAEKNLAPTYFYQFSYDSDSSILKKFFNITLPGTTHGDDLQFLFYATMLKLVGGGPLETGTVEYKVMDRFTQMWTDFAKTGNPTPVKTDLIPTLWRPLQNSDVYDYLEINENLTMESIKKGEQRCEWNQLKNKL